MNSTLVTHLYREINAMPIYDIHTHIQPQHPTGRNIGEILSYHYYTELVNSAEYQPNGFPLDDPEALTRVIFPRLHYIRNTVQYDWLMVISETFLGIPRADWEGDNWHEVYRRSVDIMDRAIYVEEVVAQTNLKVVYLTNSYDDDLDGFDTSFYVPNLRVEPFVIWTTDRDQLEALGKFLGRPIQGVNDFDAALEKAFAKFASRNMGYAAISAPPNLITRPVESDEADTILKRALSGEMIDDEGRNTLAAYGMNRVADQCRKYGVPFHLMIGADRDAYAHGVPSGCDLFNSVNSLRGYDHLFNAYPDVRFPTAVLADTSGLELTAAAWIRHNVFPSGHWWYSNQPTEIAREVRRRLNAVPQNKSIGYFSDAYYLEFILPKFRMYKFELACALAERIERAEIHPNMAPLSIDQALELAHKLLVENPRHLFDIG